MDFQGLANPVASRDRERGARETVMEVPGFGTVRFTAKRLRHKHGKSVHYIWSATKVVVVFDRRHGQSRR